MIDFGVSPEEFRAQLLDQRPQLFKRAVEPGQFSWADLNQLLFLIEPSEALFKLFAGDGVVPLEHYSEEVVELGLQRRRLHKERFSRLMAGGATLVLNRLELSSPQARRLADAVGRYTGQTTNGGNAYLSFGGRGSFGRHWDVHDVFAMQFIGRKRWQLFAPTFPLPLVHHTYSFVGHQCPATPALDCVLEPGDLLYIPRGWWHNVVPLQEASFHLSVGVFVPSVLDYVMWSCNRFLQGQLAARKGLGAGGTTHEDLQQVMRLASAAVLDPAHLADFTQSMAAHRPQPMAEMDLRLFADPNGERLAAGQTVALSARCAYDAARAEAVVDGARLKLDQLAAQLLKLLAAAGPLSLAALCQRAAPHAQEAVRATLNTLAMRDVVVLGPLPA